MVCLLEYLATPRVRRYARAEEVVRMLESLGRALGDLSERGATLGGRAGEALHDAATAAAAAALARRCYYVAQVRMGGETGRVFLSAGVQEAAAAAAYVRRWCCIRRLESKLWPCVGCGGICMHTQQPQPSNLQFFSGKVIVYYSLRLTSRAGLSR